MKSNTAAAMALFGLLLTFGAVGGMEDPANAEFFVEQCLIAMLGLGLMACGVLGLQNAEYHD